MKFLIYRQTLSSIYGIPTSQGSLWVRLSINESVPDDNLLHKDIHELRSIFPWWGGFLNATILSPRSLQKYTNVVNLNIYLNSDTAQKIVEMCDKEEK